MKKDRSTKRESAVENAKRCNVSFEFTGKIGMETEMIELFPALTVSHESKTITFKWIVFYIQVSKE